MAKLPTYTGKTKSPNIGNFSVATGAPKMTPSTLGVTNRAGQQAIQSISNIAGVFGDIAKNELEHLAKERGAVKAQQDFAELKKLQDYKQKVEDRYRSFNQENNYEEALRIYEENPDNEQAKDVVIRSRILENDIKETDEQMEDMLSPDNQFQISEKVRSTQLNEMFQQQIMVDAKSTIMEIYKETPNDPELVEQRAKKMLDYMGNVPEEYRETIKYNIEQEIKRYKGQATQNLIKQQKEAVAGGRNQAITLTYNDVTQKARDLQPVTEEINQVRKLLREQVKDGVMTEEQMMKTLQGIQTETTVQKAYGEADKIMDSDMTPQQKVSAIEAFADDFLETTQPLMDQSEKEQIYMNIMNRSESVRSQFEASISAQEGTNKDYVKDVIKRLGDGKDVGQKDVVKAKEIAQTAGLMPEFTKAMNVKNAYDQFQAINPVGQKRYLDNMMKTIEKREANGQSTLQLRQVYDFIKGTYKNNKKKIDDNPMGYMMDNPMTINGQKYRPTQVKDFDSEIKRDEEGNPIYSRYNKRVAKEMGERWNKRREVKNYVGKFKMLSEGEAALLNRRYSNMNKSQKSDFLLNITESIGLQQSSKLFSKMWKDKADSSIMAAQVMARGGEVNKTLADDILQGQKLRLEGEIKLDTDSRAELDEIINQQVMFASKRIKPQNLTIIKQTIKDAYLGRAQSAEDIDPDLVKEVFERTTGGTVNYRDTEIFAPEPGKDSGDVEEWIETISKPDNDFIDEYYQIPDGYDTHDDFKEDLENGELKLESVGYGKYAITSQTGFPVKVNGEPFVLDWYVDNPIDMNDSRLPWYDESLKTGSYVDSAVDTILKSEPGI